MKKLIYLVLFIVIGNTVFGQSWNNITGKSSFTDSVRFIKFKNSAGGDSILSTDITGKLKQVLKPTGISTTGIDSITIHGDTLTTWRLGTPSDYPLGSYFRYVALNYDSTQHIFLDINSAPRDSGYLPSTKIKGAGDVIITKSGDTAIISVIAGGSGTGLISGGRVWYYGDSLIWNVGAALYGISPNVYSSSFDTLHSPPADVSQPRKDAITLDIYGNSVYIAGDPSPTPQEPFLDPSIYLIPPLTIIDIPAMATSPAGITTYIAYNENLGTPDEFTLSASGLTINGNNSTAGTVYRGAKSIDISSSLSTGRIMLTNGSSNFSSIASVNLSVKLKAALAASSGIRLRFLNGTTGVSGYRDLSLSDGFDKNSTAYQTLSIDVASMGITGTKYTALWIYFIGQTAGAYVDYVNFQSGVQNGNSDFITNTFVRNDSLFHTKNGINTFVSLINQGGTGSSDSTLQQIIDGSIRADGDVLGNLGGKNLSLDSVGSFSSVFHDDNGISVVANSSDNAGLTVSKVDHISTLLMDRQADDSTSATIQSLNNSSNNSQSLKIVSGYSVFEGRINGNNTLKSTVLIANPDTTSTPTYTFGGRPTANGVELVLFPTPSGGIGSGISKLGTPDSTLVLVNDSTYRGNVAVLKSVYQARLDSLALVGAINTKLNTSDTTNKWIQFLAKNAGNDSLLYYKNGTRVALSGLNDSAYVNLIYLNDSTLIFVRDNNGRDTVRLTPIGVFTSSTNGLAPASGGGTTNFLRADGTWAAASGGGSSISGLTGGTATNLADNTSFRQRWAWSTLGADTGFVLHSGSTAAATNKQVMFAATLAGANATTTQTTIAGYFNNTHTGTLSTNVGLYASASGGTNNYAAIFPSGSVGIGTSTPSGSYMLSVIGTGGIYSSGAGGVAYWVPNGVAIRGEASAANIYIDGNPALTGQINLRATNIAMSGAASAASFSSGSSYNINGAANTGYSNYGLNSFSMSSDSSILRINDNTTNKRVGTRASMNKMQDDNTSPTLWSYNNASIFELNSTTRALLLSRLTTTQRDAIALGGLVSGTRATGSLYTNGTYYNVPATGGSGSGATFKIIVSAGGVLSADITLPGNGYLPTDVLSATLPAGSGFTYTVTGVTGENGLTLFNTTTKNINVYNGVTWNPQAVWGYVAKTSTYSVLATDYTVDCTANSFTVTLPTAVGISGRVYIVKNSGAGSISLATTSSQTIDGSTTYTLGSQYKYVTVQSNNANWIVVANN